MASDPGESAPPHGTVRVQVQREQFHIEKRGLDSGRDVLVRVDEHAGPDTRGSNHSR